MPLVRGGRPYTVQCTKPPGVGVDDEQRELDRAGRHAAEAQRRALAGARAGEAGGDRPVRAERRARDGQLARRGGRRLLADLVAPAAAGQRGADRQRGAQSGRSGHA
jgi:hypothetical protein